MSRAFERLSSGKRINSARDDSAGLAISERMNSEIRAQLIAIRNANDASSILQSADGAIGSLTDLVQRMREIAVQASNDLLSVDDRSNLNLELQALVDEFDRIVETSSFNGNNLIDGTFEDLSIQLGSDRNNNVSIALDDLRANNVFTKEVSTRSFSQKASLTSGGNSFSRPVIADFNEDGNMDIVAPGPFVSNLSVFLGAGDGSFTNGTTITGYGTNNVSAGDINNDGHQDLLVGYAAGGLGYMRVLLGDGRGSFAAQATISTGISGASAYPTLRDIDQDGDLDILSTNSTVLEVYTNNGSGVYSPNQTIGGPSLTSADVIDLNGDGHLDIVWIGLTGILSYMNNGNGTYSSGTTLITDGDQHQTHTVGDFDNDGDVDLAIGTWFGSHIMIYRNNGNGTLTETQDILRPGVPTRGLVASDVDRDGSIDLVATDSTTGAIVTLWGNGSGNFNTITTTSGFSTLYGIAVGDLTNDGFVDYVATNSTNSTINILTGNYETVSAVGDINVLTAENAQDLLEILQGGLESLVASRARVGALQNRLDFAVGATSTSVENLSAAHSQLIDADYASETAELVKFQILQQAQVSVLQQANLSLQTVLQLLRA